MRERRDPSSAGGSACPLPAPKADTFSKLAPQRQPIPRERMPADIQIVIAPARQWASGRRWTRGGLKIRGRRWQKVGTTPMTRRVVDESLEFLPVDRFRQMIVEARVLGLPAIAKAQAPRRLDSVAAGTFDAMHNAAPAVRRSPTATTLPSVQDARCMAGFAHRLAESPSHMKLFDTIRDHIANPPAFDPQAVTETIQRSLASAGLATDAGPMKAVMDTIERALGAESPRARANATHGGARPHHRRDCSRGEGGTSPRDAGAPRANADHR